MLPTNKWSNYIWNTFVNGWMGVPPLTWKLPTTSMARQPSLGRLQLHHGLLPPPAVPAECFADSLWADSRHSSKELILRKTCLWKYLRLGFMYFFAYLFTCQIRYNDPNCWITCWLTYITRLAHSAYCVYICALKQPRNRRTLQDRGQLEDERRVTP